MIGMNEFISVMTLIYEKIMLTYEACNGTRAFVPEVPVMALGQAVFGCER